MTPSIRQYLEEIRGELRDEERHPLERLKAADRLAKAALTLLAGILHG